VGFARRLVRKSVRKATPRSVRRVTHPIRTVKYAVTPRPIRQLSRAVYTVTNPLGAAENALIDAALNSGTRRPARRAAATRQTTGLLVSPPMTRAQQGATGFAFLDGYASIERERFAPAVRPVIPVPEVADLSVVERQLWARRSGEVSIWRWRRRRRLHREVRAAAEAAVTEGEHRAADQLRTAQVDADRWWEQLQAGDAKVLTAALDAAFADNTAPVEVLDAHATSVSLRLTLPGPEVLPEQKPFLTPTGRVSAKAWTKTDHAETYAQILGAHLLATVRETWAVGPSVIDVRVIGVRHRESDTPELLFDVALARGSAPVDDDHYGDEVLAQSPVGLHRSGRTREVAAWPPAHFRPQV
jgi:hypothetical protein